MKGEMTTSNHRRKGKIRPRRHQRAPNWSDLPAFGQEDTTRISLLYERLREVYGERDWTEWEVQETILELRSAGHLWG
jgi:hypothetical protein